MSLSAATPTYAINAETFNFVENGIHYYVNYLHSHENPIWLEVIRSDDYEDIETIVFPEKLMLEGLPSVDYPDSEISREAIIEKIGDRAFVRGRGKIGLTNFILPSGLKRIGNYAFVGNPFKEINIPTGVTYIGEHAFNACYMLKSIKIPESTVMLDTGAFLDCEWLDNVTLPSTLKVLGSYVFRYCGRLKHIYCYAVEPPVAADSDFGLIHNQYYIEPMKMQGPAAAGCIVHVPAESVSLYANAPGWSCMRIEALTPAEIENHYAPEEEIDYSVENGSLYVNAVMGDEIGVYDCNGILLDSCTMQSDGVYAYKGNGLIILRVNSRSDKIIL